VHVPSQYASIQEAIDSSADASICVGAGTWEEDLRLGTHSKLTWHADALLKPEQQALDASDCTSCDIGQVRLVPPAALGPAPSWLAAPRGGVRGSLEISGAEVTATESSAPAIRIADRAELRVAIRNLQVQSSASDLSAALLFTRHGGVQLDIQGLTLDAPYATSVHGGLVHSEVLDSTSQPQWVLEDVHLELAADDVTIHGGLLAMNGVPNPFELVRPTLRTTGSTLFARGAFVWAQRDTLHLVGSGLHGGYSELQGADVDVEGLIMGLGTDLRAEYLVLEDHDVVASGARASIRSSLSLRGATVELARSHVVANHVQGGDELADLSPGVWLQAVERASVRDVYFWENSSETTAPSRDLGAPFIAGALTVDAPVSVLQRVDIRAQEIFGGISAASVALRGSEIAASNLIVADNHAAGDSVAGLRVAGLWVELPSEGRAVIRNADLIDNRTEGPVSRASAIGVVGGTGAALELSHAHLGGNMVGPEGADNDAPLWSGSGVELFALDYTRTDGSLTSLPPDIICVQCSEGLIDYVSPIGVGHPRDLRLQPSSPSVDAGNPNWKDDNGTRIDLGAYGGNGGSDWHPRP